MRFRRSDLKTQRKPRLGREKKMNQFLNKKKVRFSALIKVAKVCALVVLCFSGILTGIILFGLSEATAEEIWWAFLYFILPAVVSALAYFFLRRADGVNKLAFSVESFFRIIGPDVTNMKELAYYLNVSIPVAEQILTDLISRQYILNCTIEGVDDAPENGRRIVLHGKKPPAQINLDLETAAEPAAQSAAGAAAAAGPLVCPFCGAAIETDGKPAKFCPSCGARLDAAGGEDDSGFDDDEEEMAERPEQDRKKY